MNVQRYTYLRNELIRLYKLFTERTFLVTIPLSSFMTLKELERAKENPPLIGFEHLSENVERPLTINKILLAVSIMDVHLNIGFTRPRQDIPVIYDAIENWIQHWIEIKLNAGYLQSPPIEELELIEKLGRHIFTYYAHYHHEKINKVMRVTNTSELTLLDVLQGRIMYGADFDQPISYISHLDHYKAQVGYSGSSSSHGGALDFLKGFGAGL